MPRLALQLDNGRVWVTLNKQRLVSLRGGDSEGLKVITTWLVDSQIISIEEAAALQGVMPRTVEAHRTRYAETGNSADLIDRRHFNPGQLTDYRMEPHKPELIRCATLNLVRGEKNSERGLAAQLDGGTAIARDRLADGGGGWAERRDRCLPGCGAVASLLCWCSGRATGEHTEQQ